MPDTHGFETVAEFSVPFLRKEIQAAWKSGGDESDPNVIPESFDLPAGQSFGGWTLASGHATIPQAGLDVAMATDVNGIELILGGMAVQVEVENPPVPSASVFSMTVDARVKAPVGTMANPIHVGILLDGIPLGNVTAQLTSGDPVAPILPAATEEMVHALYEANGAAFPHTIDRQDQPIQKFGITWYTIDVFVELFDDASDPARRITISYPTPAQIAVSVPVRIHISDVQKKSGFAPTLKQPMTVEARLVITAPYVTAPGSVSANLPAATVTVDAITPVAGVEGQNFTDNDASLGGLLTTELTTRMIAEGQAMATAMGPISFTYPTVAQIEQELRNVIHGQFVARGAISVWTPETGSGQTQVNDVTVKALPTALAICVNAGGGADANAMADFIPAGREFAIGLSAAKVLSFVNEAIDDEFAPFPHRFTNVDGHDADLHNVTPSLVPGAIRLAGDVTVIDAVAWSIDVDASFEVDVGLHWEDNADGSQRIEEDAGDPDVTTGVLGWILAFLLGFITFGLIGVIIVVVILVVVQNMAETIGGKLAKDSADNVTGIEALPEQLEHIGNIDAKFENPIGIASDGVVFSG